MIMVPRFVSRSVSRHCVHCMASGVSHIITAAIAVVAITIRKIQAAQPGSGLNMPSCLNFLYNSMALT
jgi:hypothetical protein